MRGPVQVGLPSYFWPAYRMSSAGPTQPQSPLEGAGEHGCFDMTGFKILWTEQAERNTLTAPQLAAQCLSCPALSAVAARARLSAKTKSAAGTGSARLVFANATKTPAATSARSALIREWLDVWGT